MNILNRRRQMGGKALPYDAEIEYLQSTGKQYIDTGILAKLTNSYKIDCEVVNLDNNRKIICGSYIGQGDKSLAVEFGGTSNQKPGILRGWVQQGNVNVNLWTAQALLLNTNINVYWEWDPNTKKLKIEASDGQTSINDTSDILNITLSDATSQTFWLFKDHRTSSTNVIEYPLRIKHLKLYENDILVRDFIPVRKDTTGYMYDKVSGQLFGNSGTGNFTLGQDIVPIEYLQSSGTQYIQLGFGFDRTDEIDLRGCMLETTDDRYFCASRIWNNNNNRFAMMGRNQSRFAFGFGNKTTNITEFSYNIDNLSHVWTYANNVFAITDLNKTFDVSSITFGGTTTELRLFYGYNTPSKMSVYYYKHKKNGVLVADLIPVRVGQVGYMFDKITHTLYGNAGTGDFILGPDKT